jgi:hypothetical protein
MGYTGRRGADSAPPPGQKVTRNGPPSDPPLRTPSEPPSMVQILTPSMRTCVISNQGGHPLCATRGWGVGAARRPRRDDASAEQSRHGEAGARRRLWGRGRPSPGRIRRT